MALTLLLVLISVLEPRRSYGWRLQDASILIEDGDTLWAVADEYLGAGSKYDDLLRLCPASRHIDDLDLIHAGLILACPSTSPPADPTESAPQPSPDDKIDHLIPTPLPPTDENAVPHWDDLMAKASLSQQQLTEEIKRLRNNINSIFCYSDDDADSLPDDCMDTRLNTTTPVFLRIFRTLDDLSVSSFDLSN